MAERDAIAAGIDAGSRAVKLVLLDAATSQTLATGMADQGVDQACIARTLLGETLADAGLGRADIANTVATGYGRYGVGVTDQAVTEITCHARGALALAPEARTVIDIGGQDSKLIRLSPSGTVRDFQMNDRCAAGTGRFLEVVAQRLGMSMPELGDAASRSAAPVAINSTCVVFAETEIIGLLASNTPPADIVAGVRDAIVKRVAAMAGRRIDSPIVFTGGVALVPGMARALSNALGHAVRTPAIPQMTGALGAALIAADAV